MSSQDQNTNNIKQKDSCPISFLILWSTHTIPMYLYNESVGWSRLRSLRVPKRVIKGRAILNAAGTTTWVRVLGWKPICGREKWNQAPLLSLPPARPLCEEAASTALDKSCHHAFTVDGLWPPDSEPEENLDPYAARHFITKMRKRLISSHISWPNISFLWLLCNFLRLTCFPQQTLICLLLMVLQVRTDGQGAVQHFLPDNQEETSFQVH